MQVVLMLSVRSIEHAVTSRYWVLTPEALSDMQAGSTPSCTTPFGEEPGRIHRSDRQAPLYSVLSSHALLSRSLRALLVQAVAKMGGLLTSRAAVQVHSSGGQWSQVHLPLNGAVQSLSESPLLEFVLNEAGHDAWDKLKTGRPSAPAPSFRVWQPPGGRTGFCCTLRGRPARCCPVPEPGHTGALGVLQPGPRGDTVGHPTSFRLGPAAALQVASHLSSLAGCCHGFALRWWADALQVATTPSQSLGFSCCVMGRCSRQRGSPSWLSQIWMAP